MQKIPKEGWKGLVQNWQADLIAALSVSMVALPLGLGIAIASGVSPIAGVFSAIIGGLVTTFFRGSHVSINGPTAGLIAVILVSLETLDEGTGKSLNYVFAAIVVAGALQVLFGLLKFGKFADLFHSTVVHGILAAIGIIIFVKQIHVAMGTTTGSTHIVDVLLDAFYQIPNINPFIAVISLFGLFLLLFHKRISYKVFHFLPAPVWVLICSVPFVYAFNFFEPHSINLLGRAYEVGPNLLINIPKNILDAVVHPDFGRINSVPFWAAVISITLIASIESLASSKAVDKLDPYKRKTNLNKDLMAVGLSTMVCGLIGGLPIISVIVRSTVNVHNGAKTKWSNFFHGALLLLFIFLLAPVIQKVPLAALAIILVHIGFKLASPKVFRHVFSQGIEQLIFFTGTLIITLSTNLLVGLFGGLLLALVTHLLLAKLPVSVFFRQLYNSGSTLKLQEDGSYKMEILGIANFLATMKFNKLISQVPAVAKVEIDFSKARLVDFSTLEHFDDFKRIHEYDGGSVTIKGLGEHNSTSAHQFALKVSTKPRLALTGRQHRLEKMAKKRNWHFQLASGSFFYLQTFQFFKTRPFEEKINSIKKSAEDLTWEVLDIQFEEGGYTNIDRYQTTIGLIRFDFPIPPFTIEKKVFPQRYLSLWKHKDIDYQLFSKFNKDFIVKVNDKKEMRRFMKKNLKALMTDNPVVHHLESNGEAIILFTDNLQEASVKETEQIADLAQQIYEVAMENKNLSLGDTK